MEFEIRKEKNRLYWPSPPQRKAFGHQRHSPTCWLRSQHLKTGAAFWSYWRGKAVLIHKSELICKNAFHGFCSKISMTDFSDSFFVYVIYFSLAWALYFENIMKWNFRPQMNIMSWCGEQHIFSFNEFERNMCVEFSTTGAVNKEYRIKRNMSFIYLFLLPLVMEDKEESWKSLLSFVLRHVWRAIQPLA